MISRLLFTIWRQNRDPGGSGTPRDDKTFYGFDEDEIRAGELRLRLRDRRIMELEKLVEGLLEQVKLQSEDHAKVLKRLTAVEVKMIQMQDDNMELKVENESLKDHIRKSEELVQKGKEKIKKSVRSVEVQRNKWISECHTERESLMKIIDEQKKEEQNLRQKVVKVIKEEEKLVRKTVEKYKQVVVFGLKEEKVVNRIEREEKERNTLSKILKTVTSEDNSHATSGRVSQDW